MSETAPESTNGSGLQGVLTRKVGPLPMWGWMGIALLLAIIWYAVQKKKSGSNTTTGAGSAGGTSAVNSPGGVDSSLVPQFINQEYVNTSPPVVNISNPSLPSSIDVNVGQQPVQSGASGTNALASFEGKSGGWTVKSIGGQNFGLWGSDGKYSLATIAKSHGTTPQQIISATTNYGGNNSAFQKYVSAGNYNAKLPLGVALAIPITGSGAANP